MGVSGSAVLAAEGDPAGIATTAACQVVTIDGGVGSDRERGIHPVAKGVANPAAPSAELLPGCTVLELVMLRRSDPILKFAADS